MNLMTDLGADVLTFKEGLAGRLRLNRPKALHSLNRQMVRDMASALIEWRNDPDVRIILIDHAEGRGFCAGGDVVDISQNVEGADAAARAFFFDEYRLNHLEYTYPKPGVAFMDGVTMGGGVGIGCPCRYRVATENTLFAMPETTIGIFPDVGGGRYLSRLRGRLAQFLALTGARSVGRRAVPLCALPPTLFRPTGFPRPRNGSWPSRSGSRRSSMNCPRMTSLRPASWETSRRSTAISHPTAWKKFSTRSMPEPMKGTNGRRRRQRPFARSRQWPARSA